MSMQARFGSVLAWVQIPSYYALVLYSCSRSSILSFKGEWILSFKSRWTTRNVTQTILMWRKITESYETLPKVSDGKLLFASESYGKFLKVTDRYWKFGKVANYSCTFQFDVPCSRRLNISSHTLFNGFASATGKFDIIYFRFIQPFFFQSVFFDRNRTAVRAH